MSDIQLQTLRFKGINHTYTIPQFPEVTTADNGKVMKVVDGVWSMGTDNDNNTKNTAGATNTSSKIFLIGATAQSANPQTYSHDTVFVNTSGKLEATSGFVGNLTGKADSATRADSATTADSATRADSATTATSATKATQDGNGNVIATTYARFIVSETAPSDTSVLWLKPVS